MSGAHYPDQWACLQVEVVDVIPMQVVPSGRDVEDVCLTQILLQAMERILHCLKTDLQM